MTANLWSLVAYIATICLWNLAFKRNIGEAMGIGWLVVLLFAGDRFYELAESSVEFAATQETLFAALAFVFMAYVMDETGLVTRMVDILNSLLGTVAGGAGYIATLASGLFGLVSGSASGNAAAVGTVTIPWMRQSKWPASLSAVLIAGNAGLGIALPPNSSMFLLLGTAAVAQSVSTSSLYLALFTAGLWTLLYRLILVRFFVHKHRMAGLPRGLAKPLRETLRSGWPSLTVCLGILLPIILTTGPVADSLSKSESFGSRGLGSVSMIVWIPVLVTWIALLEGRRYLPRTITMWVNFLERGSKRYVVVGATLFFAFAAGHVMTVNGMPEDLGKILQTLDAAPVVAVTLVGAMLVIVAGPLTSTASIAALGSVAFSALTEVGVAPVVAAASVLIFTSTEGASPPNSAPIFIAAGIAGVDPVRTFVPLLLYYVLPVTAIGILIALGVLPIASP